MKLRKQLFTAFFLVAVLPLLFVSAYLVGTNVRLAFDLYGQELYNSTEIQADLVEERLNRLMVRAGRFVAARPVQEICAAGTVTGWKAGEAFSDEVLKFTDETLDSVSVFALIGRDGSLIYSSGSNEDNKSMKHFFDGVTMPHKQVVLDLPEEGKETGLAIVTPVEYGGKQTGWFIAVCRPDYFLKMISRHKQMETTTALIYCREHGKIVASKQDTEGNFEELHTKAGDEEEGELLCRLGNVRSLVYFKALSKTPWILVSSIPVRQIILRVLKYGLITFFVIVWSVTVILLLSERSSKRILEPLQCLLGAVEEFFLSEAKEFPKLWLDPKTEIGYLAGKFAGLSNEIALAQAKLRESDGLYQTLLKATYELRLVLDYGEDDFQCSLPELDSRLRTQKGKTAPEKVLSFLDEKRDEAGYAAVEPIVMGKISTPQEAEVCCDMGAGRENCWYRLIAVPIEGEEGGIKRMVIHFEDITRKKQEEQRLIRSSQVDPLCGLLNKNTFLEQCQKAGTGGAVFFIDLDQFKQINDTLGHSAGDEVLTAAAMALESQFGPQDVVGRYGGDEFIVFSPGLKLEEARKKAGQLAVAMNFKLEISEGRQVCVSGSVGVAVEEDGVRLKEAVDRADEAMYCAKENGKSGYYIFNEENGHE